MRTKLLGAIAMMLFSLSSYSTHLIGGEIYWDCQGNGDYIFHLKLYRDCTNGSALLPAVQTLTAPSGTITLNRVSTTTLAYPCSPTSVACGSTNYVIEEHLYTSSAITLTGTPPVQGWDFSWTACCRPATLNYGTNTGQHLSATMFADPSGASGCNIASPRFLDHLIYQLRLGQTYFSNLASPGQNGDSLYYSFAPPRVTATTNITYPTGYSFDAPFPDKSESSMNDSIYMDHNTGMIYCGVDNPTTGGFPYAVKVEAWQGHNKVAEIRRDAGLFLYNDPGSNSAPVALIDTSAYPKVNRNNNRYFVKVLPGDTLAFNINGSDFDFLPSGVAQSITFGAIGSGLSSPWLGGLPGLSSYASLSPVAPQVGFTSLLNNQVAFEWYIDPGLVSSQNYFFNFFFHDNHCMYPYFGNLIVEVEICYPASITPDTLGVCEGDSVLITGHTTSGTYNWSPASAVSSTSGSPVWVTMNNSGYIYLTDPANPGFKDSVYVHVEEKKTLDLSLQSGLLTKVDSINSPFTLWFVNGIPFYHPYDTLTPFAPGDYWVEVWTDYCHCISDTVTVLLGSYFVSADPANGNALKDPVFSPGSHAVSFQMDATASGDLLNIYLVGVYASKPKTGNSTVKVRLYDSNNTMLFSADSVITSVNSQLIRFEIDNQLPLTAGSDYTILIEGDSTLGLAMFENVQVPHAPFGKGMTINGLMSGDYGQAPSVPSSNIPIFSLQTTAGIGLPEVEKSNYKVYPVPSKDVLFVEGDLDEITVYDLNGRMVPVEWEQQESRHRADLGHLPKGLYTLSIKGAAGLDQQKIILQ